jgi:hypothetical protein
LIEPQPQFPPMHPVTRLGRVIQQLRSFDDLHAAEFDALAAELEATGASEAAAKVRVYSDVQRDESQLVIDELVDIQAEVSRAAQPQPLEPPPADPQAPVGAPPEEVWRNSPKRAKWLAEEAQRDAEARQPRTRRELFSRFST